ncbi:hypothetical protein DICPUDRAFT_151675 [Dictyostelium purpureum]|uniref:FHA domain-containing protein n=1 Tax=Dictyostelium purpureum TaxID=5786 RepID=F0ZJH0_DICPU|nr:uncharacterized protein DICPUDRAFT_151675 [Dictyostelium purpureum]EGC35919.1 hypothetical protein DICPUDRAFT_151675 [Dictyostelium purpureum]|eukprot:XP_003287573.1 hypothetical protein DICPUDRAFT_151675 [Dictyostelium purpureum]
MSSYREREYRDNRDSRDNRDRDNRRDRDKDRDNYKRNRNDNEINEDNSYKRDENNKRLRELQTYSDKRGDSSNNKNNNYSKYKNDRNNDRKKSFKDKDHIDYSKYEFGRREDREKEREEEEKRKIPKEKPDFKPSGALLRDKSSNNDDDGGDDENKVKLKWVEPSEASFPKDKWVIYPFKEKEALDPIYLRKKAFLFGRDREISDIPTDHPSCSSQHAVLVFRKVKKEDKRTGEMLTLVLPYLIDLESTNGTFYNGNKLESSRYLELKSKDSIKFGQSTREYILLREDTVDEEDDDESDN